MSAEDVIHAIRTTISGAQSTPVLFAGAGMSIRYLGLMNWTNLLKDAAKTCSLNFQQYQMLHPGKHKQMASGMSADFFKKWIKSAKYKDERARAAVSDTSSYQLPFKQQVAALLRKRSSLNIRDSIVGEEIELLRQKPFDLVVTTNYDCLFEDFLSYEYDVYSSQAELMFSRTVGVGEIYKIHGCIKQPDSIVLTEEDYACFESQNIYLSAKLISVFLERPVIFVGYAIKDDNIEKILSKICAVMDTTQLKKLEDRLLVVEWNNTPGKFSSGSSSFRIKENEHLRMKSISVPDFRDVYRCVLEFQPKLPVSMFRKLERYIYNLVQGHPGLSADRVRVIAGKDADNLDVVIGVGVIEMVDYAEKGYKAITREELLKDVMRECIELVPSMVLNTLLPNLLSGSVKYIPVFRYLKEIGALSDSGEIREDVSVDEEIRKYVKQTVPSFRKPTMAQKRAPLRLQAANFSSKEERTRFIVELEDIKDTIELLFSFEMGDLDLDIIRNYINDNIAVLDSKEGPVTVIDRQNFIRLICSYDHAKFGIGL